MERQDDYGGLILPEPPQAERKAAGHILMDGIQVADTLQCVHCNKHFISIKGSGIKRGWCSRCGGVFCGPKCVRCMPFEKKLDDYEKGIIKVL